MEEELKMYIDAIKGMEPNIEMCSKYIPKKYCVSKLFGESVDFLVEKFIEDWDSSGRIVDKYALEALYKLLNFGPEVMALYEGFDPRCQAQILYDKYKEKYVKAKMCERINETNLDDCEKVRDQIVPRENDRFPEESTALRAADVQSNRVFHSGHRRYIS